MAAPSHDPPPAERAPAAVLAAGGVFLPADVCFPLWRVLRAELDRHRANGGRVRPEVSQALDALRAAALAHVSAAGLPERTSAGLAPPSPADRPLWTTSELATALGCTDRHARRLAAAEGITPAGRGLWHRDDAAALVASRRTDRR